MGTIHTKNLTRTFPSRLYAMENDGERDGAAGTNIGENDCGKRKNAVNQRTKLHGR